MESPHILPDYKAKPARLPSTVIDSLVTHALREFPNEACGMLIGSANGVIISIWPAKNVAQDPLHRYDIAPTDHLEALRTARHRGERIVGIYHSRNAPTAFFSDADQAGAWEGWQYFVVAVAESQFDEIAVFTLEDANTMRFMGRLVLAEEDLPVLLQCELLRIDRSTQSRTTY